MSDIRQILKDNVRLLAGCKEARRQLAEAYGRTTEVVPPAWEEARQEYERSSGRKVWKFFGNGE